MDAILLREAGGLGDILQVGSAVPLLHKAGYVVHLYTLPDPAMLEIARLIRGLDYVHPLRMVIADRRPRGDMSYHRYPYLNPVLAHAYGTTNSMASGRNKNKLYDMFCPGWSLELGDMSSGEAPKLSRAQAFVMAAGYNPGMTKPVKLRTPQGLEDFRLRVRAKIGDGGYTVFAPWAKDPVRSVGKPVYKMVDALAEEFGPLVVLDYGTSGDGPGKHYKPRENVMWYPHDFGLVPTRGGAVGQTVELVSHAARVVSVESFPIHLAASLSKPAVLLSGPTLAATAVRHCNNIVNCESADQPDCAGCYYQNNRGFVPMCRERGCKAIDLITPEDVVAKLREVCT